MSYHLYWGDLHCHCSISYGYGTVEQALARAKQQLDFCSITGHAFWPDMPRDRSIYADIIDYHTQGFATLAANWNRLLRLQAKATEPGDFVVFPSYEWHSCEFGDHNVYGSGPDLPLRDAPDLPALRETVEKADGLVIPHHIGYKAGYRGIDWRHYREDLSPFVEIFSLHGCSLGEHSPYPMLHTMGPRDFGSTAETGWALGHRFGIVGGTDHHAAYPGSHGDGRMGVFAETLTRQSLWEAFLARRLFAATGDRIDARLAVNDAWIGSIIRATTSRRLRVSVRGIDALEKVEVIKNGRVIRRLYPEPAATAESSICARTFRLRITWGWGRNSKLVHWNAKLTLSDGMIVAVDPCFSGQAVVAPKENEHDTTNPDEEDLPHAVLERNDRSCTWRSATTGNLTMRHPTTQALSLEIESPPDATLTVEVNGQKYVHRLSELLNAGRSHYPRGWLSEAIRIGPLIPIGNCLVETEFIDEPEEDVDVYRLQVAQLNGQWAWLTPIWCQR